MSEKCGRCGKTMEEEEGNVIVEIEHFKPLHVAGYHINKFYRCPDRHWLKIVALKPLSTDEIQSAKTDIRKEQK
jgi:hypothetical protein